jgi:hypothetical protein
MNELAVLLQDTPDLSILHGVLAFLLPLLLAICIVVAIIVILPFWFICKKAGFSPWLSLLNLIPFGNLILIYVLAFAGWKVIPAPQFGYPPLPPQPPYPQQPPAPPQG